MMLEQVFFNSLFYYCQFCFLNIFQRKKKQFTSYEGLRSVISHLCLLPVDSLMVLVELVCTQRSELMDASFFRVLLLL